MSVVPAYPGLFSVGGWDQPPETRDEGHPWSHTFLSPKQTRGQGDPCSPGQPLCSQDQWCPELRATAPPHRCRRPRHPSMSRPPTASSSGRSDSFAKPTSPRPLEPLKSKSTAAAGSHSRSCLAQAVGFKLQPDPGPLYNKYLVILPLLPTPSHKILKQ